MRMKFRNATAAAIAAAATLALMTAGPAEAADAFNALKGSWSGGGKATFAGGQTERLTCAARYSGGGASLSLALRCASPSAQINLSGNLGSSGNKVSGNWSETSFGLSGAAHGSATKSAVRLRISGGTIGSLSIAIAGQRQTVAFYLKETALQGVNISLRRR
jgi:hypothetical protein